MQFMELNGSHRTSLDSGFGGGSGIRTRDTVSRIHTFQACAFNRSATPPYLALYPHLGNRVSRVRLAFPPPLCWGMSHAASPIIAWDARASAEGPLFGRYWRVADFGRGESVSFAREMAIFPAFFAPLAAAGRNEAQSPIPAAVMLPGHGPIGQTRAVTSLSGLFR
jgi:hypothetical protein